MSGTPTDRILLDTGASTTIVHQRMVSEKDYTGDVVDSRGSTQQYPKTQVTIHLQGDQEYNQEVAMSDVVPEDVLLGRDAPIGVPLLATFSQQERKAMWEDINREFAGGVIMRCQAWRTPQQEAEVLLDLLDRNGVPNLEMPMTSMLDGVQSATEAKSDAGNKNTPGGDAAMLMSSMEEDPETGGTETSVAWDRVDQDSRSVQVNSKFHFNDALFAEPGLERIHHTRAKTGAVETSRTQSDILKVALSRLELDAPALCAKGGNVIRRT